MEFRICHTENSAQLIRVKPKNVIYYVTNKGIYQQSTFYLNSVPSILHMDMVDSIEL